MNPIILFDMDDVIVDWRGAAHALLGPRAKEICDAFQRNEAHHGEPNMWDLIKAHPTFWLDLKKNSWSDNMIKTVENLGLDWYFCTAQSNNDRRSASHKIEWVENHGWDSHDKMCITKQKWLVAGPNKVLIDDKDSNIEDFRKHGGYGILMPQPWNKASDFIDNRLGYVFSELLEITQ